MSYSLVLLNGSEAGKTLRLEPDSDPVTVGRHESREMQLDDDRASRLHARVVYRAGCWHVEDCGSLNGTFVNSQPVKQTILESGDLIRIADRLLLFVDNTSSRSTPMTYRSTTVYEKHPIDESDEALVEKSLSDSMSRVIRDSAVLCRLANVLHQYTNAEVLIQAAIDALVDGIDPDAISVWMVGSDGRLRCAARWGDATDDHLLASLAVERDKAILIEKPASSEEATVGGSGTSVGAALAVPIPGQHNCRGAIECRRGSDRDPFERSDLDFSVVVAHQAGSALENLEHRERLEQANEELRRRLSHETQLHGSSPAMQEVLEKIALVGPTNSTVLILGESGTGKELIAHSIHDISRRSAGPYVAVNCAAFSESLLESELFGHEAGAFTSAERQHIGQFERAHRGTIFLDEVGEMSTACQAKLLRMLEGHPFQRLGGQESIHVDVRVIAATHRDLLEMVQEGKFRQDLYYRLRVIDILSPPLRDRGEDVVSLAALFLEQFRQQMGRGPLRFSPAAIRAIREYDWPGNVRELRNSVERAVVLGKTEETAPADLGLASPPDSAAPDLKTMSLRDAEYRHIAFILNQCDGNKTEACRILNIGRGTLYKKLEEMALTSDSEPPDEKVATSA